MSQWLNKTFDLARASKELRLAVETRREELRLIRDTCGEDAEACTTEYLRAFSVNDALHEHQRRQDARAAQAEAEARRQAAERAKAAAPVTAPPSEEERQVREEARQTAQSNAFVTASGRLDCEVLQQLRTARRAGPRTALSSRWSSPPEDIACVQAEGPRKRRFRVCGCCSVTRGVSFLWHSLATAHLRPPRPHPLLPRSRAPHPAWLPCSSARPGTRALQAASPSVPVEITAADGQHFTVSFADVRNFICAKATDAECKIFLETCKQYRLNPFTKEAYLIHYDNNSEDASTIVLGKNCYMQMAERHSAFDGFEAGIIVLDTEAGQLDHREGSIVYEGEELLGGWAKVYRKDRTRPSYEEVKLAEYDTGKSLWKGKKATMIRKVALVHALREAFPSTFGTLYDESEVPVRVDAEGTARELDDAAPSPRWTRIRDTAAQADALAVEDADEPADDPFAGGEDA